MTGAFGPMPITPDYTACSVNATPNLGRYVASLEVVPLPQKIYNLGHTKCGVHVALVILTLLFIVKFIIT